MNLELLINNEKKEKRKKEVTFLIRGCLIDDKLVDLDFFFFLAHPIPVPIPIPLPVAY